MHRLCLYHESTNSSVHMRSITKRCKQLERTQLAVERSYNNHERSWLTQAFQVVPPLLRCLVPTVPLACSHLKLRVCYVHSAGTLVFDLAYEWFSM